MIPGHVLAWAARPAPRTVLTELRGLRERGRGGARSVLGRALTSDERQEVGRMLDARWAFSGEPLLVGRLARGLAAHGVEIDELLEAVGGPLRDIPAERRAARAAAGADLDVARQLLRAAAPEVDAHALERCLAGTSDKTARAREILAVTSAIGAPGERLPVLAARLFSDAHALDRSRPLGRAVARYLSGTAPAGPDAGWTDPLVDAAGWRGAWAARGIVCDEVSTQVLVLNTPLVGSAAAVHLTSLQGEPVWLTLRSLRGDWALADGVEEVFVCENPSVVEAAADRWGTRSRPLVCTFGVPGLAAHQLLAGLATRAVLAVRADGDDAGRRIVRALLRLPGARPWRMPDDCTAYEEELLEDLLLDLAPATGRE